MGKPTRLPATENTTSFRVFGPGETASNRNETDRFHLVIDVIDRVPRLQGTRNGG